MKKEIIKDEAVLSVPCEPGTAEDTDVVQDLLDTITQNEDIACLAANQIGVTKAIAVYLDDNDEPHALFNPKFMRGLGAFKTLEECFSVDGQAKVTRYQRAMIKYDELQDGKLVPKKQEFQGWTAQVIQHAIDHCKGKLV